MSRSSSRSSAPRSRSARRAPAAAGATRLITLLVLVASASIGCVEGAATRATDPDAASGGARTSGDNATLGDDATPGAIPASGGDATPGAAQAPDPTAAVPPYTALLELGPDARRGIDFLAPDASPYWFARYHVAGAIVDVRYLEASLVRPAGWPALPCGERALRGKDGYAYFEAEDGWSMLVDVAEGVLPPGVNLCRFVDRFVSRHLLFANLERTTIPGRAPVFPAVIEL